MRTVAANADAAAGRRRHRPPDAPARRRSRAVAGRRSRPSRARWPGAARARRARTPRSRARLAALRPERRPTSTSSWSRSTRRAPTASAATASRGVETPNIDALAADGHRLRERDRHRAAHLPVALVDLHRPHPAAPRRARQRRLLPRRRAHHARRAASRRRATPRAPSSGPGCSSRAGGSPRASTSTPTASSSRSTRSISLGTVQKPGDEVMDGALAWLDTREASDASSPGSISTTRTRPTSRRSRSRRATRASRTSARSPTRTRWSAGSRAGSRAQRPAASAPSWSLIGDHGESLGDHGEATPRLLHLWLHHARAAHRAHAVGTHAGRSPAQVSSVDIMPTVLDLARPRRRRRGSTAARSRARSSIPRRRSTTPRTRRRTSRATTSAGSTCAACATTATRYVDAPQPELYDLAARIPARRRNVFKAYSQRAESLRVRLEEMSRTSGAQAPERKQPRPGDAAAAGRARVRRQRHRRRSRRRCCPTRRTSCRCSR